MPLRSFGVARVPMLLPIAMSAALAGVLIEFLFYASASRWMIGSGSGVALFANVYLGLNLAALLAQLFLMSPLQRGVGLGGVLMVLPAAVVVLTPLLLLSVSVMVRSALRLAEGGLKSSVHRVAWEQAFALIEPAERSRAKLLTDGTAARLAEGVGGILIFVGTRPGMDMARAEWWAGVLLMACSVCWVTVTATFWSRHRTGSETWGPLARVPDS